MLMSLDIEENATSSKSGNKVLTKSLPALDTSTTKSAKNGSPVKEDSPPSYQDTVGASFPNEADKTLYCDDYDWDIDNFDVFHEVIIGENNQDSKDVKAALPSMGPQAGACSSKKESASPRQHGGVEVMQSKRLQAEKLRKELLKIESELKTMEHESSHANV